MPGPGGPATISPLRALIPDHVAPERLYLEARWSSLVPYAAAAGLLADVLPVASGANANTLREHTLRVAERAEAELGEEQSCFIEGCPAQWAALPIPEGRIETQRQWSDRAIARTTPCLLGLFFLTALLGSRLSTQTKRAVAAAAWYRKTQPTFADTLAAVRQEIWAAQGLSMSRTRSDSRKLPSRLREGIAYALCHAA